jgi:hypothetical protein
MGHDVYLMALREVGLPQELARAEVYCGSDQAYRLQRLGVRDRIAV